MGYLELFVIFLGSIGLALLLGTGTAYLRYRRTGSFPGQPEDARPEATAAAVRGAKVRMVLGAALAAPFAWILARLLA
ncbi:hypothetical protein ER308_20315 [Egibacter rhizosphaerae]|uniref:Uncharacterized protein n=1 Tax=Egibacter rhizosphaerae TaxID=1670831 RepID=A0A411YKH1_9ACTN|nr:hypothetical protein [Egibacter rhizosphaerae]QBI21680.1 hypothetical protein ER308_20315 [Egibacter rhizosphaerae]